IAGRQLDWKIRDAELFVDGDLAPDAGVAGVGPGILLPRVDAEFAGLGNGVEGPEALPSADVESADVAFDMLSGDGGAAGEVGRANDHDIFSDHGGGVQSDFAGGEVDLLIEILLEIDDAGFAEGGDGRAGFGVERDESIAGGDVENALLLAVGPVGEA